MGEVRGIIFILTFSCCLINISFPIYSHMDIENNQSEIKSNERLKNMITNSFIEDVIPSSICYGNFLEETPENEIILGTKNKELFVLDHDLTIIFYSRLDSNAKKIEVVEIDQNTKEKILVISTEVKILLINKYVKIESLNRFNKIVDFKILDINNDSKNEIIVLDGKKIKCYNLSGEEIWSFEHDKSFFKIVPWNELSKYGGFLVSTKEKIHLFSSTGLCSFEIKLENEKKIKDFIVCNNNIFILSDDNKIYKFDKMNKVLSIFYSKENDGGSLSYISKISTITAGIILHGYTGELQILSYEGERLLNENYTYEVASLEEKNLDNIQSEYMPKNNIDIDSFEIIISITRGKIIIFSECMSNEEINLINQINYEILDENDNYLTIKSTMVFPIKSDIPPYKILVVDNDNNLRRYDLYKDHYETLNKYILALESFYNGKYYESKVLLKEITSNPSYSSLLEKYRLKEISNNYLEKSKGKIDKKIENSKIKAEVIYSYLSTTTKVDYKKVVSGLYDAYKEFINVKLDEDDRQKIIIYESKTLYDLEKNIKTYLLYCLKEGHECYEAGKFEEALEYYGTIYPIANNLMDQPGKYISDNDLYDFEDLSESYKSIDDILMKIKLCIEELFEKSEEAFDNGDYRESERINELLIQYSSELGLESKKYESKNSEITLKREEKNKKWNIIAISVSTFITIFLTLLPIIYWKKWKYKNKKFFILCLIVTTSILISLIGSFQFFSLVRDEQILNLRSLSSSLTQSYFATFAIIPGILIALMTHFASKYPSHLIEKIIKSSQMRVFLIIIILCISLTFSVLISIPTKNLNILFAFEIFSIILVIFSIVLVITKIIEVFNLPKLTPGFMTTN